MHKIVITIDKEENTNFLIELLKKFKFIKSIRIESETKEKNYEEALKDLNNLFGIWKNRDDLNKSSLREKAWKLRK